MSAGSPDSATHRNGPGPRRTAAGCRRARSRGSRTRARSRRAAPRRAGCCRSRTPRRRASMKPTIAAQCAAADARARWMYSSGSSPRRCVGLVERQSGRDVALERVVGARLVGDDVGLEALAQQLGEHLGGVRAHGRRDSARRSRFARTAARDRVGEVVGLLVEVARLEPAPDPVAVDLDAQRHALVHRHRQRLRAAHPAEPGGERDRPGQRAAEAPPRDLREALVGALHDALAADVDPGAGGHLAVHRQPEVLEPAELVPGRPLRARGSSSRSARAAPTRACGTRRPACRTARAASRRRRASAGVRTIASNASQERAARPVPP